MLGLVSEVRGLVRTGTLKATIAAMYALDNVKDAVTHAAKDARGGKVLVKMG